MYVSFNGTGPFTYIVAADSMAFDTITTNNNPDTLLVFPLDSTIYTLVSVQNANCAGVVSGQANVAVAPALSAVISGGGQICQTGTGTSVTVNFQGPGPYTFIYSINNVAQPPITTSNTSYSFNVNPVIGTISRW